MPSIFTHAVAAASLGAAIVPGRKRIIARGALCAVAPDADVIGFRLGVPYADLYGHRGLTHPILAAALLAGFATWLALRLEEDGGVRAARVALYLFVAAMSHGLLDAMTDGGLGVAFFAPFWARRYFLPWRPIVVSPIGVRRFLTGRGLAVVVSEVVVVWVPALALWLVAASLRRRAVQRRSHSSTSPAWTPSGKSRR